MLPSSLLPSIATVQRPHHFLQQNAGIPMLQEFAAATLAVPAYLLVHARSLTAATTVEITGTLEGTSQTETLALHDGVIARSRQKWSSIQSLRYLGGEGVISASLVYGTNSPACYWETLSTTLAVRLRTLRDDLNAKQQGLARETLCLAYFNPPPALLPGDRLIVESQTFIVQSVTPILGQNGVQDHVEATVQYAPLPS